jgi:pimeloyl-ACP methyl ester carboxylesterase
LKLAIIFILLFTYTILFAQNPEKTKPVEASDFLENYEPEPIFNDSVYTIQSGMEHDTSVVLIHGIGTFASSIWDGVIPNLRDHFHVIAVDLPGFGMSTKQNTLYSPDRYAEFIDWLIGKYAKPNVILVGHSMGGGFALCYAGKHGEALTQLVLIDVCGVLHRAALTKYVAQFKKTWGPKFLQKPFKIVNDIWQSLLDGFERPTLDHDLDNMLNSASLRDNVLGSDPNRIAGLALAQYDFSGIPEQIGIPTTIIWGEKDDITPIRTAHILNAKIQNSKLFVMKDVIHSPQLEQPDEFNNLLQSELLHPSEPDTLERNTNELYQDITPENKTFKDLSDTTISGIYDTLSLARCQRVNLIDFKAKHVSMISCRMTLKNGSILGDKEGINILRSEANFENCTILSQNIGLRCRASEIEMTLSKVKADTAIATTSSRFDLAAVTIEGGWIAVWADVKTWDTPKNVSDLLFSISYVGSPLTNRRMHEFCNVSPEQSL